MSEYVAEVLFEQKVVGSEDQVGRFVICCNVVRHVKLQCLCQRRQTGQSFKFILLETVVDMRFEKNCESGNVFRHATVRDPVVSRYFESLIRCGASILRYRSHLTELYRGDRRRRRRLLTSRPPLRRDRLRDARPAPEPVRRRHRHRVACERLEQRDDLGDGRVAVVAVAGDDVAAAGLPASGRHGGQPVADQPAVGLGGRQPLEVDGAGAGGDAQLEGRAPRS